MEKNYAKFFLILLVLGVLTSGFVAIAIEMAKRMESSLLKDTQILQNYRDFQYMADQKRIAKMPNDVAKKVPEIKNILDQRNTLLAKKAPGCTLEYRAASGVPSAYFEPIKVHCEPAHFWKWLLL